MNSPLKNKINTVFIPVNNIEKAKHWYEKILGVEGEIMHGHLCVLDMVGTGVILDEMPLWRNEEGNISPYQVPSVQFGTNDIQKSYQFMKDNGVELVTGIEHGHFFVIKDPDGNMLMVCQ
ncbi:VOC family protein [Paucisalibacillus sp. EB02]|uniref:VOC family protein n=1 Tax=Paucisalibacillus sp. EB02 TaxID=1347087 RepID=UPI0009E055DB|nr:VOC family protein [Paucisalibacillus sp. EB02]